MKTKLTLSIEKSVIQEAREVLEEEGKNLSRTFEDYLKRLISRKKTKGKVVLEDDEILSEAAELAGIFKLPKNKTFDELRWEAAKEKFELDE